MQTKRTTRAIFLADHGTIDVKLPTAWEELTQAELPVVYDIITQLAESDVQAARLAIFRALAFCRVVGKHGPAYKLALKCRIGDTSKVKTKYCFATAEEIAELLEPLSFIEAPGAVPVRPDDWHSAKAVDAALHGLTFGEWLQLENYYQAYISTKQASDLQAIAQLLYPGLKPKYIDDAFKFGLLQWVIQVKQYFAKLWPNFFRPAEGEVSGSTMLDITNAEIRALTGGDVTKEDKIMETECWRALTELDYKAKEAAELKKQLKH